MGNDALWGRCWRLVLITERIFLCALLGRRNSVTSFSGQKMIQEQRLSQDAELFSNTPSAINILKLCRRYCSSLGDILGGSWSSDNFCLANPPRLYIWTLLLSLLFLFVPCYILSMHRSSRMAEVVHLHTKQALLLVVWVLGKRKRPLGIIGMGGRDLFWDCCRSCHLSLKYIFHANCPSAFFPNSVFSVSVPWVIVIVNGY